MARQNDQPSSTTLEIVGLKRPGRCSIGVHQDPTYWACSTCDDTIEGQGIWNAERDTAGTLGIDGGASDRLPLLVINDRGSRGVDMRRTTVG